MSLNRDTVVSALRAEDVANHYGITGSWRGRWLRSSRCAVADHGGEAFGISRDGMFHCWSCDTGGDLLKLIALGEKLDIRHDFGKVLEVAAAIAGVEDDESFGAAERPAPRPRAPLPALPSLADRIVTAKKRAAWAWNRLVEWNEVGHTTPWGQPGRHCAADHYLSQRGLDPAIVRDREELRGTPLRCTMEEMAKSPDLKSLAFLFATPGFALPVRGVDAGELVDIRIRRFEPRPDQPKIIGMVGGITTGPAEGGRPRQLVGCYGRPHELDDQELVVIVEGALDYLTALQVWPTAWVLGAVDAGSMGLVAGHAARRLAERGPEGRILLVEQNDRPGVHRDGTPRLGAADASINEDPNAATKVAMRLLGPKRVGWLFCEDDDGGGASVKDLNDLFVRRGAPIVRSCVKWWVDLGRVT